jgi:hypothetical protein
MIRYKAKLKLLKHGLLLESQRVDGIGINDFLSNDDGGDDDIEPDNSDKSDLAPVEEHISALGMDILCYKFCDCIMSLRFFFLKKKINS